MHPDAQGTYLTGIECDGATYHRSATAQDRDKLREQVLRGLGWEILRVWSTDWWIDAEATLEKLDGKLRSLLAASRVKRAAETEMEAARVAIATAIAKANEDAALIATSESAGSGGVLGARQGQFTTELAGANAASSDDASKTEVYARNIPEILSTPSTEFIETDFTSVMDSVNAEAFFDASYLPQLARMIARVVEVEGPVRDSVLGRRIARAHGWQRTGSRIQEQVEALAAKAHGMTEEDVETFYWAKERGPEMHVPFRRPTGETGRTVDEICMPELVSLAREVLASGKANEDAIMAMARELGLQRLRAASRGRFERAMQQASE